MSVKKVKGSWVYDFQYEGKRYRKRGFRTKKDALHAEKELYVDIAKGGQLANNVTFIDYFEKWIKVNKEDRVTQSTLNRYYNALNIFHEKFGSILIKDVSQLSYREMLKEYAEGKYIGGRPEGRTKESVKKLNNCFSQAFKDALNEKLIYRDPTWNAPIYEKKAPKSEKQKYLSLKNYQLLKQASTNSNELSYLAIYIMIATGARFGEVQKLKRIDIDKSKNTIHLRGTKTKSSDRYVTITSKDMSHIINVINSRPLHHDGYIFNTGITLITNKAVTTVMRGVLAKHEVKSDYGLHSLRHTHASMLLGKGFSIQYVSKRLGHSNIEITWRVYSHLLDEIKSEEDKMLDAKLSTF
ncbi:integrase [Staphylococcus devriesei]|nr:integrase [Staphylococcus devriesei]